MPAYHSVVEDVSAFQSIADLPVLPLKTDHRGPAPKGTIQEDDIIDEAFKYYRANVFFKHFKINTPVDRVFIYVTLYIQACIQASQKSSNADEAKRALTTLAVGNFSMPGDPRFPINAMYHSPENSSDSDQLRQYLQQIRNEVSERFLKVAFADGSPDKWWFCLSKRKFMNVNID